MSKPKKPRHKKYVPRPALSGGGLHAIAACHARYESATPLRDDQLTDLGSAYWLSFHGLTNGDATEEQWSCVVCSLNIAMALAEAGIGAECEQDVVIAMDGAFRAKIRSERTGNFRLDGDAVRDITAALHMHDEQMKLAHRREIEGALLTVQQRVKAGHVYTVAP